MTKVYRNVAGISPKEQWSRICQASFCYDFTESSLL